MSLFQLSAPAVTWTLLGLACVGLAIAALLWQRSRREPEPSWARWMLPVLVAASLLALPVYFYSTRWISWPHHWDLFHTVMGAKYHRELGYSRLYACAVERDARGPARFRSVERVRDLSTYRRVSRQTILDRAACADRFDAARGAEFDRDLGYFQEQLPTSRWRRILRDKGYNGSPFYTALAATVFSRVPLSEPNLVALGLCDPLLILLAMAAIGWAAGLRTSLLALLFFTSNFPNRFEHMGGSFLRFDYVAYLVIGIAALARGRHATAGAFLGLSTMVRLFPGVFIAGYGLHAAARFWRHRRVDTETWRFVAGCAASMAACLAFSLIVVGADAWVEFLDNLLVHTDRIAAYRIGLKALFVLDDGGRGWPWLAADGANYVGLARALYWLSCAPFAAVLVWLAPRLRAVDYSVLFGLVAFYVFFVATRYYYSVLVVLFLLALTSGRGLRAGVWAAAFAVSASGFVVAKLAVDPAFTYNVWMSALLGAFYASVLAILVRDALRSTPEGMQAVAPATNVGG